jgi:hypothetical protein
MVFLQGFGDSSHLFGQALQQDLNSFNLSPNKHIQYVDDPLLRSPSKSLCETPTIILLNSLAHWGLRVSRNKAQLISTSVSYMGLINSGILPNTPKEKNYHTLNPSSQDKKGHSFFSGINQVF